MNLQWQNPIFQDTGHSKIALWFTEDKTYQVGRVQSYSKDGERFYSAMRRTSTIAPKYADPPHYNKLIGKEEVFFYEPLTRNSRGMGVDYRKLVTAIAACERDYAETHKEFTSNSETVVACAIHLGVADFSSPEVQAVADDGDTRTNFMETPLVSCPEPATMIASGTTAAEDKKMLRIEYERAVGLAESLRYVTASRWKESDWDERLNRDIPTQLRRDPLGTFAQMASALEGANKELLTDVLRTVEEGGRVSVVGIPNRVPSRRRAPSPEAVQVGVTVAPGAEVPGLDTPAAIVATPETHVETPAVVVAEVVPTPVVETQPVVTVATVVAVETPAGAPVVEPAVQQDTTPAPVAQETAAPRQRRTPTNRGRWGYRAGSNQDRVMDIIAQAGVPLTTVEITGLAERAGMKIWHKSLRGMVDDGNLELVHLPGDKIRFKIALQPTGCNAATTPAQDAPPVVEPAQVTGS